MKRITKALKGATVTFHGYDGNDYRAEVTDVTNGTATLRYFVRIRAVTLGPLEVTAFIDDPKRIEYPMLDREASWPLATL